MSSPAPTDLPLSRIRALFWPLALSWLLMGIDLPLFAAVVARLPDNEVNLAAFGALVFPVSLFIEAPIIMLLAAATALVHDRLSYRRLYRFMMATSCVLTVIHVLVAFTPLFDVVARDIIGVREQFLPAARVGLQIMTPWTWAIAYRRMHQGVLIRFEQSRAVGLGTFVRLAFNAGVLLIGVSFDLGSGIVIGCTGIAAGVTAEAVYIGWRVRPVLAELPLEHTQHDRLTWGKLLRFYVPLALTPMLTLTLPLIGSAAMAQMPRDVLSFAAWPAVHGLVFLLRGIGMAYNEVVVALIAQPGALRNLRRVTYYVAAGTSLTLAFVAVTPLASLWFEVVSGLTPQLTHIASVAVGLSVLMPFYEAFKSFYQGALVSRMKTRAIPEAVAIYLATSTLLLLLGSHVFEITGIYFTVASFTIGGILQTSWLWYRSRESVRFFAQSSAAAVAANEAS